ncbi:MAG: PDZ domain-containing protein [Planctomycetota bacterium]|nr:MAG: PDZ domain-containing protein [Planctomycetota bacterium]
MYRHGTVTPGWVARNETTFEYVDERYIEVLPVAGLSARGASGGAWVNERGEVVGVQSSMMSLREIPQGLLFAAPLHAVRDLLHSRTDAVAADMGLAVEELWEKPPEVIREYPASTRGLYVAAVVEDGPAAQAGLAVGSVITAVEGRPVRFRDQLLRLMRTRPPGGTLRLTVITREAAGPRQVTVRLVPLKEVQQRTREGGKK